MNSKPIEKQFWKYVLPAMLTTTLDIFYVIVDGFFVGQAVGDPGLAAINLAWPVAALCFAVAKGIGSGGAVVMSTRRGAGDEEGAERARGNTVLMLLAASAVLTVSLTFFLEPVLRFLGAEGQMLELAMEYTRVVAIGCGAYVMSSGLTPLLRNRGKTVAAMCALSVSMIANVLLDALLTMVIPWGMFGAALATVISEGLSAAICAGVMLSDRKEWIRRRDLVPERKTVWNILKIGASPMGLFLSPSLVIVFSNWQCLAYGGEMAVAVYSVLSYLSGACQSLLQGVGEGVQPIISYCRGAENYAAMKRTLRKAAAMTMAMAVLAMALIFLFRGGLPDLFGTSEEVGNVICRAALFVMAALPFLGATRLLSSYFYAVDEPRLAMVMAYADPAAATPVFVFLLPMLFDLDGVWLAYPAAQAALAAAALWMLRRYHKRVAV